MTAPDIAAKMAELRLMTRVKICGCRSVEQALAAAEAGADFVGLMFAPRAGAASSWRTRRRSCGRWARRCATLEMETPPAMYRAPTPSDLRSWFEHGASALERLLERKRPLTVGVFADNDPDEINEIVDECGIDLIQLSGGEPWGACLLANRQVIKVLHVASATTPPRARWRASRRAAPWPCCWTAPTTRPSAAPAQALDWRVAARSRRRCRSGSPAA